MHRRIEAEHNVGVAPFAICPEELGRVVLFLVDVAVMDALVWKETSLSIPQSADRSVDRTSCPEVVHAGSKEGVVNEFGGWSAATSCDEIKAAAPVRFASCAGF